MLENLVSLSLTGTALFLREGTAVAAEIPAFTIIDVPGASVTVAGGINPRGDIVGRYITAGVQHGFLLSSGTFNTIDPPGSVATEATMINSEGDIVGVYVHAGVTHGFLLS